MKSFDFEIIQSVNLPLEVTLNHVKCVKERNENLITTKIVM